MNAICNMLLTIGHHDSALWNGILQKIYGNEPAGMAHHSGYCKEYLKNFMQDVGFRHIKVSSTLNLRPTPTLLAGGVK